MVGGGGFNSCQRKEGKEEGFPHSAQNCLTIEHVKYFKLKLLSSENPSSQNNLI